jgi:hypothetical protein
VGKDTTVEDAGEGSSDIEGENGKQEKGEDDSEGDENKETAEGVSKEKEKEWEDLEMEKCVEKEIEGMESREIEVEVVDEVQLGPIYSMMQGT